MTSIASPSTLTGIHPTTPSRSSNTCSILPQNCPSTRNSARIVPELADPKVRERFLYSYRLIYELSDGEIHILAVIHGRRPLESLGRFSD